MESRYVDVFVSHKMEDAEKAKDLKRRIESLGLTCWIDDDDEGGFAEVFMPVPAGAVDHFVRLMHNANAEALQASRG